MTYRWKMSALPIFLCAIVWIIYLSNTASAANVPHRSAILSSDPIEFSFEFVASNNSNDAQRLEMQRKLDKIKREAEELKRKAEERAKAEKRAKERADRKAKANASARARAEKNAKKEAEKRERLLRQKEELERKKAELEKKIQEKKKRESAAQITRPKSHINKATKVQVLNRTRGKNDDNCVLFARSKVSSLPYGLDTWESKRRIINSSAPAVGSVAIISVPSGKFAQYGHVAVVESVGANSITVLEANYSGPSIQRRISTANNIDEAARQLNIVGYYRP